MSPIARRWSMSVSTAFHPVLIPWAVLFAIVPVEKPAGLITILATFLLIVLFPAGASLVYFRRIGIGNILVIDKEYRIVPFRYFFAGLSLLAVLTFLLDNFHLNMQWFVVVATVSGAALLITFYYKISLHMTGMGAIMTMVFEMRWPGSWVLIAGLTAGLSAVVFLARYALKAHTVAELLTGFVLGLLSCYAGFRLVDI